MRLSGIVSIASFAALSAVAGHAAPPSVAAAELLANNPFFPNTVQKITVEAPQFELRGIIKEKDGYLLNIYDLSAKKSSWVKEGRRDGEFVLSHYDPIGRVAALEKDGRRFSLASKGRSSTVGKALIAQIQAKAIVPVAVAPSESETRRMIEVVEAMKALRGTQTKKS